MNKIIWVYIYNFNISCINYFIHLIKLKIVLSSFNAVEKQQLVWIYYNNQSIIFKQ